MTDESELGKVLATLGDAERAAIRIIALAIDCFNSRDGTGMFVGPGRYNVLAGRVEICAAQADTLSRFWALLLRRMRWGVPPKSSDEEYLAAIAAPEAAGVLRALATETASIITLARMTHDARKAARGHEQSVFHNTTT